MATARRGLLITIEGPEGAGKTTQARLLAAYLQRRDPTALHTREPGGTRIGERVRQILLDASHREMARVTEMLLFAAARAQFVAEVVRPALEAGRLVLSERFVDASLAYQGEGRGLGMEIVRRVNEVATGGLRPDLTILLDIEPGVGVRRARATPGKEGQVGRGDRMEQEDLDFHRRVREGFLALAREEPERIVVIDGQGEPSDVHARITRVVERFLRERGWPPSS